jgi:hypothetical protein
MKTEIYFRHILLHLCPLWFCNIFCNHLVNGTTVVKIVCAVKFVLILSKKFNWKHSYFRKKSTGYCYKLTQAFMKCVLCFFTILTKFYFYQHSLIKVLIIRFYVDLTNGNRDVCSTWTERRAETEWSKLTFKRRSANRFI